MPAYFASDVHLRLDRPERGRRLARLVDRLGTDDRLVIAGDLCDFWFASRQADADPRACEGLRSLADFRARGGQLALLAGNHDAWLGPYFERVLGVGFAAEPLVVEAYGLRVHLVHGHLLGARARWKAGMESRAFLNAFRRTPAPVAAGLGALLDRSNEHTRAEADRRHLDAYRRYADRLGDSADVVAIGHIHGAVDDQARRPRLVVLGGWHRRSSYLRIDEAGARLIIEEDDAA